MYFSLTVAGIHGNEREGAFSVALSGGYEDDVDYGEYFTYTGEGIYLEAKIIYCNSIFA